MPEKEHTHNTQIYKYIYIYRKSRIPLVDFDHFVPLQPPIDGLYVPLLPLLSLHGSPRSGLHERPETAIHQLGTLVGGPQSPLLTAQ